MQILIGVAILLLTAILFSDQDIKQVKKDTGLSQGAALYVARGHGFNTMWEGDVLKVYDYYSNGLEINRRSVISYYRYKGYTLVDEKKNELYFIKQK